MASVKILDCTLRDGGYYTNWDFDHQLVNDYLQSFNQLPVEYVEVGYRSQPMQSYLGEYFYCPIPVLKRLKEQSNKKLVIILNEKDVRATDAEALLRPIVPYVTMVRLAVDPKNFLRAIELGKAVKSLGFELAFNIMYMSEWDKHPELMENLPVLEGLADYLYMVDSFGGVYPEQVIQTIEMIRSRTPIPLGFHGHNNLELALINALTAMEHGVAIVDATITGMGRGAGNLKTELLLTVLQAKGAIEFDFNALAKAVDGFTQLQKDYNWGTNLPYMFSGANSLPQKQVMEWVFKRYYSFNSILRALSNQSNKVRDNRNLPQLKITPDKKYTKALIIGGGPTCHQHQNAIRQFLELHPDMVLIHASSKNAMSFASVRNDQIFCLVGNEGHRMEQVFGPETPIHGIGILPPFPRTMGTYVPDRLEGKTYELERIDFTKKLQDSHTALALQTALVLGLEQVYLVGYDGYSGSAIAKKEQELFLENEYLFSMAGAAGLVITSLTATQYTELNHGSIFALI